MTYDLAKNMMKFTIFLGIIGIFIAWAFQLQNTFVQTRTITVGEYSSTMYYFDWYKYTNTLSNVWTTDALDFSTIIPTRTWDSSATIGALVNNIAYVFDWLYFPINFLAYILRWICWITRLSLGLLGWDFSMNTTIVGEEWEQYNSVLIKVLTWITQKLVIPYI